jgi:hypothetical protein
MQHDFVHFLLRVRTFSSSRGETWFSADNDSNSTLDPNRGTSQMNRQKLAILLGVATVTSCLLAAPATAQAASAPITVDGKSLDNTTQPSSFTVTANPAKAVEKAKFYVDSTYLGADATAPYTFPVKAGVGKHELQVRYKAISGSDFRSEAHFTVNSTSGTSGSTPSPAPQPSNPAPTPSTGAVINVSTSQQLQTALTSAKPGQTIKLADGTYAGKPVADASGTAATPITLTGSPKAVLTTGSISKGYGLHVTGDYWNISGLSVTNASKGIVMDGATHVNISKVDVGHIGDEAVHFRAGSDNGVIQNSNIHDTGLDSPSYGEGVYLGSAKSNWSTIMGSSSTFDPSNNNQVLNNTFKNIATEAVDVKEGTSGGVISGNTFTNVGYSNANYGDSWVDVKGNDYRVLNNSGSGTYADAFQVHKALAGWGNNTVFSGNKVISGVPGYEVNVQSGVTGTVIDCHVTVAGKGLSNISCMK